MAFVILKNSGKLEFMELATEIRNSAGKSSTSTKNLRAEGKIPAEFYGRGMENKTLMVDRAAFRKLFKEAGENTVITLLVDGKKQPCLVHDVQYHPLTNEIAHVDFYGIRMDEKLQTMVPVEFTGEAPAVKEKGGIVMKAVSEIEVEALPADLPHSFTVDLSALVDLGQSIYVKDIAVPQNVKVLSDPETVLVNVTEPAPEEEITPPAIDIADVKVESEEKAAERAAGKEAEPNA